jgi:riboflavin kinase/FMN adenylyltransferase
VYAANVKIDGRVYQGALYLGPRLVKDEQHDVLEVYVLDYEDEIYGRQVEFILRQFIRPVRDFVSLEDLKKQITADVEAVRKALHAA